MKLDMDHYDWQTTSLHLSLIGYLLCVVSSNWSVVASLFFKSRVSVKSVPVKIFAGDREYS